MIWHPFTQALNASPPIPISKGQGPFLYDFQDNRYVDLISSWWVNIHGHCHPKIAKALYEQALQLEHVIFAGCIHPPALELTDLLQQVLPAQLSYFFFSDNGSTATEIALKMAYQFWFNQGEAQRKRFLAFEGGYHGDTLGAMSVGKTSGFYQPFSDLLFEVNHLPWPWTWAGDSDKALKEEQVLQSLDSYLEKHGNEIAAIILEPLIQGASGLRPVFPSFLNRVIENVRAHNILVIFDEVMTGFGRTGTLFALEQLGHIPDFLCLSKGLTGGFLPLALTVAQPFIYEAFLGKTFDKAFAHGHSYTANPLGCAAAIASLKLFEEEKTLQKIKYIEQIHREEIAKLPNICKPRVLGTIAAFQVGAQEGSYQNSFAKAFSQKALDKGLFLRPIGNTVYLMPPYCLSEEDLGGCYERIGEIIGGV